VVSPLSGSLARTIGRAFNKIFLDATLTRDVASSNSPDIDSFDPPAPTQVTYTCKAIRDTYAVGMIAGRACPGNGREGHHSANQP
jgi:hypothetical protein